MTSPGGLRGALDWERATVGRDPATGFARRSYDNVVVQYGLRALNEALISVDQFLDLNEHVGGVDHDMNPVAARSIGDVLAIRRMGASGVLLGAASSGRACSACSPPAYATGRGPAWATCRSFRGRPRVRPPSTRCRKADIMAHPATASRRFAPVQETSMTSRIRRQWAGLLLAAAALVALPGAFAQPAAGFPDKPMKIVVTFTTGGAPDILARLIGEKLQASWGQPVVIDNRPGAGGNTGADHVAKSPPDGLTVVVGTVGTHSINGALYARMPYDMVKDFTPVTLLATTPNLLVVHNDVPAKNVQELIALGKKERMTFASSGSGTSIHVSGELFKSMTGIDMQHIPYKGRASAIPDLLGGRVTMMFDNMPSSLPLVKEGKLRGLGVTSPRRSAAAPDIPTIAEQGLPGFEAVSWFALFAPANTPKPIVDKLQAEVKKIITTGDVARKLAEIGLEPVGSTSEELAAYQRAEIAKWAKVVKDSGARVE